MGAVIEAQGLVKTFGSVRALDGLDLEVGTGEVLGLLGPNGAGKSTTLRLLLGLLRADAGVVTVLGGHPVRDAVDIHRRIAYVASDATLWPNLTGGEIIDLLGGLGGGLDPHRRDALVERFELDPRKKARAYSRGNRQKVALIPAMASDAELLVLDEPTAGLDPLMEVVFQDCIREVKGEGRTVLLSSHVLAEVETLADRVAIVRAGRIVERGTLEELRHLTRTSVAVRTDRPLDGLAALPGINALDVSDHHADFEVDTDHLDDVIRFLGDRRVRSLTTQPPTLEQLFLRHYAGERADERGDRRGPVMRSFTGTSSLVRLHLRRDRFRVLGWVLGLVGLMAVRASSVITLHPTQESLDEFARVAEDSPAAAALNGPPVALDTIGGRVSFEVLVVFAATLGLMSVLLVTRHTRAEEQAGRTELLRARVVGRHAPPAAAVIAAAATNVVIAGLTTVLLVSLDLPVAGSALLAASAAVVGILFVAVAAVTAQLAASSRAANALAGGLLGAAFAARAIGDAGAGWPSWLSPIGWVQTTEPFGRGRWWPLLVVLVVAAVVAAAACRIAGRRDVGSAALTTRPGRARARAGLASPLGLAIRLQRGALIGWLLGTTAYGAVFGMVGREVEEVVESTPSAADLLTGSQGTLLEAFMATVAVMLGLITTGYVTQGLLRLRSEESEGRAEIILATSVSRRAWAGSHVAVVAVGSAAILGLSGATVGLIHGARVGEPSWIGEMAVANLAELPAVWVMAGVALLLYGTAPRLAIASWVALGVASGITFVAQPAELPQWVRDVSPFTHLPQLPGADLNPAAPALLLLSAGVLGAIGLTALHRRDLGA